VTGSLWFRPFGDPYRHGGLDSRFLPVAYDSPEAGPDSTFRWDGPAHTVIVVLVGADHCLVMLRAGAVDQFLVEDTPEASVLLVGVLTAVPAGAVLPRHRGLEVLLGAADLDGLRLAHAWRDVPRWNSHPLHDRYGDLVEDLLDRAYALQTAEPAGLRHLADLMVLHNTVMSGGVDMVRLDRPERFAEAAAAAADYFDLQDLAAVIREIHTAVDSDGSWRIEERYHALSGPFGDDAGTIRAAVARRYDTHPGDFGQVSG
jgi:hypothetical protein